MQAKGEGDVISLDSRRHGRNAVLAGSPPADRRFVLALAVVMAGLVLVGLILEAQPARATASEALGTLPADVRAGYLERAWADLSAGCRDLEELPAAVRGHCAEQARFVLLFPECRLQCRQLAQRISPPVNHSHK